ncbi:hypothetical protein VTN96DRAFT_2357 [Rasamsonia emersonii]
MVPPNCQLELDDFESQWCFSKPFDFIHGRSLAGSITDHDRFLRQCLDNLAPGGLLELCDFSVWPYADDDTIHKAKHSLEWVKRLDEASSKFGKRMNVAQHYKGWLSQAGFVNVKEDVYKAPVAPWPKDPKLKELGRHVQTTVLEAPDAYSPGAALPRAGVESGTHRGVAGRVPTGDFRPDASYLHEIVLCVWSEAGDELNRQTMSDDVI